MLGRGGPRPPYSVGQSIPAYPASNSIRCQAVSYAGGRPSRRRPASVRQCGEGLGEPRAQLFTELLFGFGVPKVHGFARYRSWSVYMSVPGMVGMNGEAHTSLLVPDAAMT